MKRSAKLWRRTLTVLAAAAVVVGGGAAALAAADQSPGHYVPSLGISVPQAKYKVLQHTVPRLGQPAAPQQIRPGHLRTQPIAGIPASTFSAAAQTPFPAALLTLTGGWMTSNGTRLTGVYAGSNPAVPTQGRIIILRQDILNGTQSEVVLNAAGTGALTIQHAPAGARAETSGQAAIIILRTATGATVTLNLAHGTLS
jgi:hypothetical protein